jgi:hypothetical protein
MAAVGQNLRPRPNRRKRHGFSQLFILFLQALQLLQVIRAHATVVLLPAGIGLLSYADLTDRIQTRHPLPHQNLNLP